MKRKGGNPNWGRQELLHAALPVEPSSFDDVVRKLQLVPEQYVNSVPLKNWVWRNKDRKYVPSELLKAWNFEASAD